ncbi:MAG: diguanylate cyclase [Gammaproteobacteria bacterium]|nr:MAG: diguanylate cyclase [Gammaproteobacteria bacterium]
MYKKSLLRWLVLIACCIATSARAQLQWTSQEAAYLASKKVITMCVDPDWMPLEKIENGKHIGMTAEYMGILQDMIGIPIKLVPTKNWTQSMAFAKARKCDIFSLAMQTSERRSYMDFTRPYLSIPLVLATRTDELFVVDISKVTDKKLGVVRGYAFGEILRQKYPDMQIVDVDSLRQGLDMVNRGELYGFIGTLVTIGYAFQRDYVGELKIAGKFDEKWELGVATRNDEPLLHAIFDKAVAAISEKQKQEILNQWLAIRYERVVDFSDLWKWLVIVGALLAFLTYRNALLRKYNQELERISVTDKLTQVYNRVRLDEILEQQKHLFQRYQQVFSIVMIDVDFFKKINDQYGHQAGDRVLIEFASLIKNNIRVTDIIGRWGGEEFLMICPGTDMTSAYNLAEKLRRLVEQHAFSVQDGLTASFGVADYYNADMSIETLIARADKALYQAKTGDRNRVVKAA